PDLHSFPTRRSSDLITAKNGRARSSNAKTAASSDVRSVAARCGLDRAQFADLGKNGHRNRELRAKYIQDRQPSSLFGCVRSRAVDRKSTRLNSSHDQ